MKSYNCTQCKLWEDLIIFYMQTFHFKSSSYAVLQTDFYFSVECSILVNINSLVRSAGEVPIHTMQAYSGSVGAEVYLYTLLTSALDGDIRSTSCPNHFTHRKEHQ
jgi:hypothetical protein